MNQDANLQDICAQQIQRWLDDGQLLSSITAAELHQATEAPYTQCLEALRNFTPGGAVPTAAVSSSVPPPPAALQEVFRQSQQLIWQTLWQEQQHALDQLKQNFSHEKKQLQQTADERLSIIEKLETQVDEQNGKISVLESNVLQLKDEAQGYAEPYNEISQKLKDQKLLISEMQSSIEKRDLEHKQLEEELTLAENYIKDQETKFRSDIKKIEGLLSERTKQAKEKEQELLEYQKQHLEVERAYSNLNRELEKVSSSYHQAQELTSEQAQEIILLGDQLFKYEEELRSLKEERNSAHMISERANSGLLEVKNELDHYIELSTAQAKELVVLTRKLEMAEQEYLRVTNLYQEAKRQGSQLQKELKGMLGR